jgi:hypothetical protein
MNNESKFQAIPRIKDYKIPFKLEESALLDWLIEIGHLDSLEACSQTLALLQALNKESLSFKHRIVFLVMISDYLKQYIGRLSNSCWDAGFPLSDDETVYAQVITWNYLTLGKSFFLAADSANKKNDAVFSIAMALYALGQAQLHIAATYAIPNDGFWSLLYKIFLWAEKKGLQHLPIESTDLQGQTINSLFAASLAFQVCDTNQYQPRDMRTIFKVLSKTCIKVAIDVYPHQSDDLFMLDLKSDDPPFNVKEQIEIGSELVRYFSPVTVANIINHDYIEGGVWSGALKSINTTLFTRVIKTLGLMQKRQYTRKRENHNQLGVIGFQDIVGFLYKINKTPFIDLPEISDTASAAKAQNHTANGEAGIQSEAEYQVNQNAAEMNHQIWQPNKNITEIPIKKVLLKEIVVCDSSANGYSVSWSQGYTKTRIGDLFGIISEDKKRLEIAIIRRIALNNSNNFHSDFRFGAELLGFESEIVYLSNLNKNIAGTWAVFIPEVELLERPAAVIFDIGHFKVGDNVYIHRCGEKFLCLLLKELHSTVAISHIEVVVIG